MKVAIYQNNPQFGKIRENVDDVIGMIRNRKFDLLVLPELFATGYQFKNIKEASSLADPAGGGYTFDTLKEFSHQRGCLIIYGFAERKREKLFNSAMAILPDGSYYLYQKTHLFDTEKEIFSSGETGFFTFSFQNAQIGIMICFDWRFPESARKLALLGAQIICHPSNLVLPHGPDAMITRALENRVYIITADRIGQERRKGRRLNFIGRSRIISPEGKILARLGGNQIGFLSAAISP
ncbi:MAG: hypothetical protein NTV06_00115, partial [candidate division Zixibacteria bacterium]|nr:hypothetical protein [candidate division Zixibacteria bacterium]